MADLQTDLSNLPRFLAHQSGSGKKLAENWQIFCKLGGERGGGGGSRSFASIFSFVRSSIRFAYLDFRKVIVDLQYTGVN